MISDALEKIRDNAEFVKTSESREQMFQACVKTDGIHTKAGLVWVWQRGGIQPF